MVALKGQCHETDIFLCLNILISTVLSVYALMIFKVLIRIQPLKWIRIRIRGFDDQKLMKKYSWKIVYLSFIKNCNLFIPKPP